MGNESAGFISTTYAKRAGALSGPPASARPLGLRDDRPMVTAPARLFAGIKLSVIDRSQFLAVIEGALDSRERVWVTFLNPDYARRAMLDGVLRTDVNAFDLVLTDGHGVRLVTRLFGFRVPERLATDSVAPDLLSRLSGRGAGIYLFGCAPTVAELAGTRVEQAYPGLRVVGTEHGFHDVIAGHPGTFPRGAAERVVRDINRSGADVVMVSLPTPMQQSWVTTYGPAIEAPVVMTTGSYLDHVAQNAQFPSPWYPPWADKWGLNWLYRLLKDPGRLWRRYTVEMAHYALLVIRARAKEGRSPEFR